MLRTGRARHAVVLAAGGSVRMGRCKALLLIDGVPWVNLHIEAFERAGLLVTVVLGAYRDEVWQVLPPSVRVVENAEWQTTDSARSAFLGLQGLGSALVMPVDAPPAQLSTLKALLGCASAAVPTFGGHDGHPVLLHSPHVEMRLDHRIEGAARVAVNDADCLLNLNTPEAFAAWVATRRPRILGELE